MTLPVCSVCVVDPWRFYVEGVKAASLNALSEGPGSESESQEQSQSAWIQYIAASILHSPTPSDMLVDTVQCILGLDKVRTDLLSPGASHHSSGRLLVNQILTAHTQAK